MAINLNYEDHVKYCDAGCTCPTVKRTDELVKGDKILTEDLDSFGNREVHTVKLIFTCEDHTRVVTDTDEIGICENNHFEWEIA